MELYQSIQELFAQIIEVQTKQIKGVIQLNTHQQVECIVNFPQTQSTNKLAFICHPHPLYQGTMNNKVVTTLVQSFLQTHCICVRFNFRGVGLSNLDHGAGVSEVQDLKSLIDLFQTSISKHFNSIQLYLSGFSFGGFIACEFANLFHNQYTIAKLILVAPALKYFQNINKIMLGNIPLYLIQGTQDEIISLKENRDLFDQLQHSNKKFIEVETCSHFFHGKLIDLKQQMQKIEI